MQMLFLFVVEMTGNRGHCVLDCILEDLAHCGLRAVPIQPANHATGGRRQQPAQQRLTKDASNDHAEPSCFRASQHRRS